MPRHTELKLMSGETLCDWTDANPSWDSRLGIWAQARNEIAEIYRVPLHQVEEIEDEDGEFFGVDGEKVAYLVHNFTARQPVVDLRPAGTVDLRPLLQAAE